MKPPVRWPLHPDPVEGEALSSWLQRIASCYGKYSFDLLNHDLGQPGVRDRELDMDPPLILLQELSLRTGIGQHHLAAMTMAGWVPWLFDSLVPAADTYQTYVHQFSVLLPPKRRKIYMPRNWLPWLPQGGNRRACPTCIESNPAVLLFWQLPVMVNCPSHMRRLETYGGDPNDFILWTNPVHDQRTVPDPLSLMDQRTWQATTTGYVDLPRRSVHAGIWFRLLRTLLDELTTAEGRYGRQLADIRLIWEHSGHPFRAGLHAWQPFETLPWETQQQLLEAAAIAMAMIEAGMVSALGTSAHLLLPVPDFDMEKDGNPKETQVDLWKRVVDSLNDAVQAARKDPAVAQSLYKLTLYGCRSEESMRRLRESFIELQLPLDYLSDSGESGPFTRLRISNQ